eukprot:GHVP01002744.1.p2 GENE.GHVP01002744.1~~GHVP01002744.1.p2  ORF type:complete len:102 (-),score=12.78 GHVP01002744.1:115-420(-)
MLGVHLKDDVNTLCASFSDHLCPSLFLSNSQFVSWFHFLIRTTTICQIALLHSLSQDFCFLLESFLKEYVVPKVQQSNRMQCQYIPLENEENLKFEVPEDQ